MKCHLTFLSNSRINDQYPALHMTLGTKDEAQALVSALTHVFPNDTVPVPVAYIHGAHQNFNARARTGFMERCLNFAAPVAAVAIPVGVSSFFGPTPMMVTALIAPNIIPLIGHTQKIVQDRNIKDIKWDVNFNIRMHLQQIRDTFTHKAAQNFVEDFDNKIKSGAKLTLSELAQLVNVDTDHFRNVCDDLAITVLSVKAVLDMQDFKIEPYIIDSSKDRGFVDGQHSDLILLSLWQQRDQQVEIDVDEQEGQISRDDQKETELPLTLSEKFKRAARVIGNFYVTGFKRTIHSVFGNNAKAEDHLDKIENTLTVPEIPTTSDLAARLRAYRLGSLDLPALEPAAFK